jgi:Ca2+-binding EF-hand superfamily protein
VGCDVTDTEHEKGHRIEVHAAMASKRSARARAGEAFNSEMVRSGIVLATDSTGAKDASKQRDERALKSTISMEGVRLAPSPEPMVGTPDDLRRHRERQLIRAQLEVATIMEKLGIDSNELVYIKQDLWNTQQKLRETEMQLDDAWETMRAHASHDRSTTSASRALSRRTHEQRDYIAAVEQQLATTRSKLQIEESRVADMMVFKQRSEQLTHQLGQERQRSRKKDEMISEFVRREEELQRQLRILTLQRDQAPGRQDVRRWMQRLKVRENAVGQVLAAVAGTVGVVDVPSRAWEEDEEPTLRSPMWRQVQLEQEPEPQQDENIERSAAGMQSPRPPIKRSTGKAPRKIRRGRRAGKTKLQGKKVPIEHMKRRLRAMSYSTKGQDPASLFMLYDTNNSGSLEFTEFRSAVRKGGQLTQALVSEAELETLFSSADADGNGRVSVHELTKFIWGEDEQVNALLEQELQGFAKALDTSSDDDDGGDRNQAEEAQESAMHAGDAIVDGRGITCDEGTFQKQEPRGSRSPQTPLYSATTGRLVRRSSPRAKARASPELILPTVEELTQLRWGTSQLVDGQHYWFDLTKPAELHWMVPPDLVAAVRRLRAEAQAKAAVAAAVGADGEGFYIASSCSP